MTCTRSGGCGPLLAAGAATWFRHTRTGQIRSRSLAPIPESKRADADARHDGSATTVTIDRAGTAIGPVAGWGAKLCVSDVV